MIYPPQSLKTIQDLCLTWSDLKKDSRYFWIRRYKMVVALSVKDNYRTRKNSNSVKRFLICEKVGVAAARQSRGQNPVTVLQYHQGLCPASISLILVGLRIGSGLLLNSAQICTQFSEINSKTSYSMHTQHIDVFM